MEYCRDQKICVQGWSPLAKGNIFGNQEIKSLAERKGVTEAQIAIRWSLQRGIVTIPKSTKLKRVEENFDVFNFQLDPEEMKVLDKLGRANMRTTWDPNEVP